MNDYLFVHNDGRRGEGPSSWSAIVEAVGRDEARQYGEFADPHFETNPGDYENYPQYAALLLRGGTKLGELFKRRQ